MDTKRLILIAEDDENDVDLLRCAIRCVNVLNPIQVVRDGLEAMHYLSGNGRYADRATFPFPGALFLDLKLPKLSGFEVLRWLKQHEECKVIPVMVLTGSGLEQDVTKAYQLGANSYMVKPGSLSELRDLVALAFRFWSTCEIPPLPKKCQCVEEAVTS
ncbi:MAG TPA: response regulator [Candidatus Saccharimonadales bacterium]|nr:response regulator [Candidatus Saccharimonadales bacterium]